MRPLARPILVALAALAAPVTFGAAAPSDRAATLQVDLALVLAVDVSESMDQGELEIQRSGYVSALSHADFIEAALSGQHGRIALAYFEWAGSVRPGSIVGWRIIESPADATAFATELAARPVEAFRGTSISRALDFAAGLIEAAPHSDRKVIDISGDGPNNLGRPVTQSREAVLARGISVNGLPLLIRPSPTFPAMDRYYSDCVTGGPGAFVLPVRSLADIAESIREKLILEISQAGAPMLVPAAAAAPVDCLVGERSREQSAGRYYPGLDP